MGRKNVRSWTREPKVVTMGPSVVVASVHSVGMMLFVYLFCYDPSFVALTGKWSFARILATGTTRWHAREAAFIACIGHWFA